MKKRKSHQQAIAKAKKIVNAIYSANSTGPKPATGRVIHWWGQFSQELPNPFNLPKGGHGWKTAESEDSATNLVNVLRTSIFQKWPGTKEWAGEGWYRWMRPDLKQMTLTFEKNQSKRVR